MSHRPLRFASAFSLRRFLLSFVVIGGTLVAGERLREYWSAPEAALVELLDLGCELESQPDAEFLNVRVPFRSTEEATRANRLLQQLGGRREVRLHPSQPRPLAPTAAYHAAIALRGVSR